MGLWICEWCNEPFKMPGITPRRFCSRAHADAWRRRDIPSPEWLREQYVTNGRTANDIAREVGRDPKRVWEWITSAGIPTRPRGSYNTFALSGATQSPHKGRKHTPEARARIAAARRRVPREAYARNGGYLRERRGALHPNWKGGISPERQQFYATDEWKRAARAVWKRGGTCQRCGCKPPRTGPPTERGHIHHIQSFRCAVELRATLSNLVLLCATCHRWVHGKANTQRRFLK